MLLHLPFWNAIKHLYESDYPTLTFNTSDYWAYLAMAITICAALSTIACLIVSALYDLIDRKTGRDIFLTGPIIDRRCDQSKCFLMARATTTGKVYQIQTDLQRYYYFTMDMPCYFSVRKGGLSKKELKITLL